MSRRSMLVAPPYEEVKAVASQYGMLVASQPGEPCAPRARTWIIVDEERASEADDAPVSLYGRLVAYYADPATGAVRRDDLGRISHADVTNKHWSVATATHGNFNLTAANCVCGGGAIAYAGPIDERHVVTWMRTDVLSWMTDRR